MKTAHRIEEVNVHRRLDILPAHRTRSRSAACRRKTTQIAEEVAEIIHVEFVRAAGARRLLLPLLVAPRFFGVKTGGEPGLAEFVVEFALSGIAQDIVCVRDIFEFSFGLLISRVDVRVILAREFAVRLADVFVGGAALDAEDLVVIAFCHCSGRIATARRVASEKIHRLLKHFGKSCAFTDASHAHGSTRATPRGRTDRAIILFKLVQY